MRWYILRTLLHKELLRHLANRGGIVLALLLVVMAMLLSFFGNSTNQTPGLGGGVQHCYVDFWEDSPWIWHLYHHVPPELHNQVTFRLITEVPTNEQGVIVYPFNAGAIQVRLLAKDEKGPRYKVWCWHPGKDKSVLAPFEAWFWRETQRYYQEKTEAALSKTAHDAVPWPRFQEQTSSLTGGLDPRAALATALVLFANFFVCVYLLPSLTCEERERGILLAQALSPASPQEILAAKFVFYPVFAVSLAAILAAIYRPNVVLQPFFWAALTVSAFGSLGVGLTISSLARTQRTASMTALCYMLVVAFTLFICQQNNVPFLSYLAIEYHAPRLINAALSNTRERYHYWELLAMVILAYAWGVAAIELFRRRGWQ